MKLRVTIDGEPCVLDLQKDERESSYHLEGAITAQGQASVAEIGPGVFSILLNKRSFTVHVAKSSEGLEVWAAGERHQISIADVRDRPAGEHQHDASGPREVRSQMPGKVVSILVKTGDAVQANQGLIVVEAMKMQNEMKSPKDGIVSVIHVREGATVGAQEKLIVIE